MFLASHNLSIKLTLISSLIFCSVSENKVLCHPSSVDSLSTSAATEDHVSMGGWAARKALRVVEHVEQGKGFFSSSLVSSQSETKLGLIQALAITFNHL